MKLIPLVLLVGLFSCNENKPKNGDETEKPNEFNFVDNFIPHYLKSEEFICINREGSIEWSSMESMLIVNKDILHSESSELFDAHYITVNHSQDKLIKQLQPSVTIHRIKLNGFKNSIDLNAYSKICRGCIGEVYEMGYGEGHCANFYTIRTMNSDSIIYISRSSNEEIKEMVKNIFSKISPQEDFQSLSLSTDCKSMDSIAHDLMFNKNIDESRYLLPYAAPVKYNGSNSK